MSNAIAASHKTGIGGSSAAAVIGCHRFMTKHDLYAEVVLGKRKKFSASSEYCTGFGRFCEPWICSHYEEGYGQKGYVPGDEVVFRSPKHNHMISHPDWLHLRTSMRWLPGDDVCLDPSTVIHGAEFKVAGLRTYREWGDPDNCEVPQEYFIQCLHSMIVTGAKSWDFCVMMGTDKPKLYPMVFSEKIASHLIEQEAKFWKDHVLAKVPPEVDESESCANLMAWLHPENTDELIFPEDEEQLKILKQYAELYRQAPALEANLDLYKNKIRDFLKDRAGIQWDQGKVTNKANKKGVKSLRTTLIDE